MSCPMEFTKRDTKILKGIAICLMLCHHLFTFPERLDGVGFVSAPFINGMSFAMCMGQFGKLCVALFTLLGGYGAYLSCTRTGGEERFTARHLRSLYGAYWRVFVLAVPISLLLRQAHGSPFMEDLIYCFLGLRFTYCNEWWFITPFALLTVGFPLVRRFADRKNVSPEGSFLWLIGGNAVIYYVLPRVMELPLLSAFAGTVFWTELYTTLTLLPAYAMGVLIAKYGLLSAAKALCARRRGLCCAAAVVVLAALIYIHPFNWLAYDFINAAVFIPCALALLSTRLGAFIAPVLERLGEESTSMWLIHALLCYHWCQKLIYAPKYAPLIFLWLLALSYAAARLVRLLYSIPARLRAARVKGSAAK